MKRFSSGAVGGGHELPAPLRRSREVIVAGLYLSLLTGGAAMAQSGHAEGGGKGQVAHPAGTDNKTGGKTPSPTTAHSNSDKNAAPRNAPANATGTKQTANAPSSVPAHSAPASDGKAAGGGSAAAATPLLPNAVSVGSAPASPAPASSAPTASTPATPAAISSTNAAASKTIKPDVLAQTKPDVFTPDDVSNLPSGSLKAGDHTQNNAFAPVGDAWRMLAYLLPMLLVIVGCLHLLKRFQAHTGRFSGGLGNAAGMGRWANATPATPQPKVSLVSALLNGFVANKARHAPARAIRLLESAAVGCGSVHLVEVRGRVLLLGGTAMGLSLLTEFDERRSPDGDGFRDMLSQAASDLDALDYEQPDLPATATVSALEDLMRETNQAVSRRSRRFHAAQEEENE